MHHKKENRCGVNDARHFVKPSIAQSLAGYFCILAGTAFLAAQLVMKSYVAVMWMVGVAFLISALICAVIGYRPRRRQAHHTDSSGSSVC